CTRLDAASGRIRRSTNPHQQDYKQHGRELQSSKIDTVESGRPWRSCCGMESIGVNPADIALIFAVDRPLDMLRTATNVSGDSMVALLMNRFSTAKANPPQIGDK